MAQSPKGRAERQLPLSGVEDYGRGAVAPSRVFVAKLEGGGKLGSPVWSTARWRRTGAEADGRNGEHELRPLREVSDCRVVGRQA
ncbi:MAG: hypothetical protein LBQ12_04620 [Deltaproteobacteria bacterium]|nr:hypothetical protein [Deltaproteobacteria bacterium]